MGARCELVTIRLGGQDGSQELAHSALLCGRRDGGLSHDRGDSRLTVRVSLQESKYDFHNPHALDLIIVLC